MTFTYYPFVGLARKSESPCGVSAYVLTEIKTNDKHVGCLHYDSDDSTGQNKCDEILLKYRQDLQSMLQMVVENVAEQVAKKMIEANIELELDE